MRAAVLTVPGQPLTITALPRPTPGAGEVLIAVRACGVCRTDLHVRDGELPDPHVPLVLGHEIVGTVTDCGEGVEHIGHGARVGVPWLGATCGVCAFCRSGRKPSL